MADELCALIDALKADDLLMKEEEEKEKQLLALANNLNNKSDDSSQPSLTTEIKDKDIKNEKEGEEEKKNFAEEMSKIVFKKYEEFDLSDKERIDISPDKDGGVIKIVIKEGTGESLPPHGCGVKLHHTAKLEDGTVLFTTRDDKPFEFDLGRGQVIKGWDIAVASMKINERALFEVAPEYAYGSNGSREVPPNAKLIFDVELLEWKLEDLSISKDASIQREILISGDPYNLPTTGSMIDVDLIGSYNGKEFDKRSVCFPLGEGLQFDIISGIEKALHKFMVGEKSRLIIAPRHAFGETGSKKFGVPSKATVEYIVTLKGCEKSKESWAMDIEEKLEQAKFLKEKGTDYFKAGKLALAIKMFKKILVLLENEKVGSPEVLEERKQFLLSSNLNLSLFYLKQGDYYNAKCAASVAIQIDGNNEKAYFRHGQACLSSGESDTALHDFTQVLKLEPNNKAAQAQLTNCHKLMRDQIKMEKKIYANMFDKFAKRDTQREEDRRKNEFDVMSSLGEWGKEDREREPSEFEKENPNILMLNGSGEFKDM